MVLRLVPESLRGWPPGARRARPASCPVVCRPDGPQPRWCRARARPTASSTSSLAMTASLRFSFWLSTVSELNASQGAAPLRLIRRPTAWSMTARFVRAASSWVARVRAWGEHLRVPHRDRRRYCVQLPDVDRTVPEGVLSMCVDVHCPKHPFGGDQGQRQRRVHAEAAHPGTEPRPRRGGAQGPGTHGQPGCRCSDARPLTDPVLHRIDLTHEVRTRHGGVRAAPLQQGHPGAVRPRNSRDRILRDVGEQVGKAHLTGGQTRQSRQAVPQINVVRHRVRAAHRCAGAIRHVRVPPPPNATRERTLDPIRRQSSRHLPRQREFRLLSVMALLAGGGHTWLS